MPFSNFSAAFTRRYMLATVTYGLIRSAPHYYDRETKYDNKRLQIIETKQMLWTEKLAQVIICGSIAVYAWPGYLLNDIALLELLIRRKDPQEHGFDQNWETSSLTD